MFKKIMGRMDKMAGDMDKIAGDVRNNQIAIQTLEKHFGNLQVLRTHAHKEVF